jgi:hypothetical protein
MRLASVVRKGLYCTLLLQYARKAVRRDATQLLALGGMPTGEPGRFFFMRPGRRAARRDAAGLTDRSVMRGSSGPWKSGACHNGAHDKTSAAFFFHAKEPAMAEQPGAIQRRGVAKNLTLDHYAAALLEDLAPGPRGLGIFLSGLIREEYARREERQRLRAARAEGRPTGQGA